MRFYVTYLWGLFASVLCWGAQTQADFYISPEGSDAWSGQLAAPNSEGTDGPFASLARARDAVHQLQSSEAGNVLVLLRDGNYFLKETVVFGLEDSGPEGGMITYQAYPNEEPVLSSGWELQGWRESPVGLAGLPSAAQGHVWEVDVPTLAGERWRFHTLYDSEGLLPRARSEGFIPLDDSGRNKLHFPAGRLKNWSNVIDAELLVRPHHAWILNILPLVSVDEEAQVARTSVESTYIMEELHFLKGTDSCWVENVLDAIDEPGEWALNSQEGKLYLWPRNPGKPVGIKAPTLKEFIRVEGDVDLNGPMDTPVRNLSFRGLTFKHGERYSMQAEDAGLQHDWNFMDKATALLRLRGAENVSIDQCHFLHCGGDAIRVDLHGQKIHITNNHIEHIGGLGVLLSGYGPGTKDVNHHNLVYNNHIHHVGRIYWHSPGIMVWQSGDNRVANNLIHHTDYTALIISGCMTDFFKKRGRELGRTLRLHEIGKLPSKLTLDDVRPFCIRVIISLSIMKYTTRCSVWETGMGFIFAELERGM